MSNEALLLVIILGTCAPAGLLIGIILRKTRPDWCKSYAKLCLNRKWWLFAGGGVMFAALSAASFASGRHLFGSFFATFALLEVLCLFLYGFKTLTPGQEERIDAWDPTRLWPPFWQPAENRENCTKAGTEKHLP